MFLTLSDDFNVLLNLNDFLCGLRHLDTLHILLLMLFKYLLGFVNAD